MSARIPLVLNAGSVEQLQTGDTLAIGALTAGRVVYVTTNGTLVDDADLTFDGAVLTIAGGINAGGQSAAASTIAVGGTAGIANGLNVRAVGNGAAGRGTMLTFDGPSGGAYRTVATIAGVDADVLHGGYLAISVADVADALHEVVRVNSAQNVGIGVTAPTAALHLRAGTATADTAPLKFTSGVSQTIASAGAVEFTTDDLYFTITTGAARKGFVFNDGTKLTSGRVPYATTNGRLTDSANLTYDATNSVLYAPCMAAGVFAQKSFVLNWAAAANQKVDLYLPASTAYWGSMEIEISGGIWDANANGVVVKSFALGLYSNGSVFLNSSYFSKVMGNTGNQYTIGDWAWDAGNSRWRIPIVFRGSTFNNIAITVRGVGTDVASRVNLSGIGISAIYTTDTTVYPAPVTSLSVGSITDTGLTSSRIPYVTTGGLLTDSAAMTFNGSTATFANGIYLGFSPGTANQKAVLAGFWMPREADLSFGWMLDYQDEFAYMHKKATVTMTPTYTGSTDAMFIDDSSCVAYDTGTSPSPIVIEIVPTAWIPNRGNGLFALGLTFRSSAIPNPNHIKIECWDNTAGAYVTSFDQDVTITNGYGTYVTPTWGAPVGSGYSIPKLKVTLTLPAASMPLTNVFRIQRMILYHATCPWDTYHIGIGGGTMYGNLTLGAGCVITSDAGLDINLTPYAGRSTKATNLIANNLTIGDGTTTGAQSAIVNLSGELRLPAYSLAAGAGTAYVQARDTSGTNSIAMTFRTQNAGTVGNRLIITAAGLIAVGDITATAGLHIRAGSTAANTAPLKFNTGALTTVAEAGAVEFLTDKLYFTITTGAARKEIALSEGLTSGRITYATTNGRLTDSANMTFANATFTRLGVSSAVTTGWADFLATNDSGKAFSFGITNSAFNPYKGVGPDTGYVMCDQVGTPFVFSVCGTYTIVINSVAYLTVGTDGVTTVNSLKDSALTAGRVMYAGTEGLLTDSANLTFNGTTLTCSALASAASADLTFTAGTGKNVIISGLKFPNADGTADYVLKTDGAGNLSWTVQTGGGLSGLTAGRVPFAATATTLTDDADLTFDGTKLTVPTIGSPTGVDLTLTPATGKNVAVSGLKFPNADGAAGQVLKTNGAGVLSWVAQGGTVTSSSIPKMASDTDRFTHTHSQFDTSCTSKTAVKLGAATINASLLGSQRAKVYVWPNPNNTGKYIYVQFRRNGVQIGSTLSAQSAQQLTLDMTQDWAAGDTFELWGYCAADSTSFSWASFKMCFDNVDLVTISMSQST